MDEELAKAMNRLTINLAQFFDEAAGDIEAPTEAGPRIDPKKNAFTFLVDRNVIDPPPPTAEQRRQWRERDELLARQEHAERTRHAELRDAPGLIGILARLHAPTVQGRCFGCDFIPGIEDDGDDVRPPWPCRTWGAVIAFTDQ